VSPGAKAAAGVAAGEASEVVGVEAVVVVVVMEAVSFGNATP